MGSVWLPCTPYALLISLATDSSGLEMEGDAYTFVPAHVFINLLHPCQPQWEIYERNAEVVCQYYGQLTETSASSFLLLLWECCEHSCVHLSLQLNSHMTYPSSRDCITRFFVLFASALVMFLCIMSRGVLTYFHIEMGLLIQISWGVSILLISLLR
jgi:hypothetical protein